VINAALFHVGPRFCLVLSVWRRLRLCLLSISVKILWLREPFLVDGFCELRRFGHVLGVPGGRLLLFACHWLHFGLGYI